MTRSEIRHSSAPLPAPARRVVRAYIGLGSNLGDPAGRLRDAVIALSTLPNAHLHAVSRLYATTPMGMTDQPDFRNAAVALDLRIATDVPTAALNLLAALKAIERAFGRQARERWGPREIDLDLLLFGRNRLALDRPPAGRSVDAAVDPGKAARLLEVPHADAHERLFVLAPLTDLAPRLVPPGWHETIATARAKRAVIEGADAVRAIATWDLVARAWRPID